MFKTSLMRSWRNRYSNAGLASPKGTRTAQTPSFRGLLPALLMCGLASSALANLGAPVSEPGLKGRSDILYFQDFEGAENKWQENSWYEGAEVNRPYLSQSSHVAFKGEKSLRTLFAKLGNTKATAKGDANHYGGTMHIWFAKNGLEEPEEVYFRYYLYIPEETGPYPFPRNSIWDPHHWERNKDGYSPEKNGEYRKYVGADKMPGFGGIYADKSWGGAGRGNRYSDGTDGWSARMEVQEKSDGSGNWEMQYYVYHMIDGVKGGSSTWDWDADLKRGTWHAIEGYVKLNTIIDPDGDGHGTGGKPDGILRGWVDGKLAFERTDLVFRYDERLKIEEIYGNFYIGGGWFPIEDLNLFTDNWVVAKNRIGVYEGKEADAQPEPEPQPEAEPDTDPVDGGSRVNVARQGTIIRSSGDDGHTAEQAIDGNTNDESRWSAKYLSEGQFFEIDLGGVHAIDRTELVALNGRAYHFTVEGKRAASDDYQLLVDRTRNIQGASVDSPVQDDFGPFEARYLRLTVNGASDYDGIWASIIEFRAFESVTNEPEPEPQPEPTPQPTPEPEPEFALEMGAAAFARFDSVEGETLDALYASPKFPASPDSVLELGSFEAVGDVEDNFGIHAWAWIVPETTGDYTFWIAADDMGILSLSPSADSTLAQPIARLDSHTRTRDYDRYSTQKSASVHLEAGKAYYLEAIMKQRWGGANLSVAWEGPGFSRQVIPGRVLGLPAIDGEDPSESLTGTVNLARFDNIDGTTLDRLYNSPGFPDSPDTLVEISRFSHDGNGSNYGLFAWAWLVPATTGDYTFWLASDDQGELMLSTSDDPAGATVIARVTKHSRIGEFEKQPEQKSATVRLEAGRAYYIAAAMKQGWGDDHLAVAWQGPGFAREILPGSVLTATRPTVSDMPEDGSQYLTGALGLARYNNIDGTRLEDLRSAAKFPATPDTTETLGAFDHQSSDFNYGAYAWGWLIPEKSGNYRFWLASDDEGELRLSANADWVNAPVIASVSGHTNIHQFDKMASQRSAEVYLEAGKAYYIEALVKQGWGGANLSVAWAGPGFDREIIPGRVLGLPADDTSLPATSR